MNLNSEYKSKLENIRGFYETGNNMPNLSDTGMLEILIDRELEEINAFYSKKQVNKSSKELTEYDKVQIWAKQLLDSAWDVTDNINFNERLERVCKFVISQPQPIQSKEIEEALSILQDTVHIVRYNDNWKRLKQILTTQAQVIEEVKGLIQSMKDRDLVHIDDWGDYFVLVDTLENEFKTILERGK